MTIATQSIEMDSLNDGQIIDLVIKITKTSDVNEMIQVLEGWADLEVHVLTLQKELEKAINLLKGVEKLHTS
jgi:hypothetical protein